MAFTGTDILAALHAGLPESIVELDGTVDTGDATLIFGAGAEVNSVVDPGPAGTTSLSRQRGRRLGWSRG